MSIRRETVEHILQESVRATAEVVPAKKQKRKPA